VPPRPAPSLTVDTISEAEHREFLARAVAEGWGSAERWVSYVQTPGYGRVRVYPNWEPVSLGWRDATGALVGVAQAQLRRIPQRPAWSLAYLPEGPVLPWDDAVDALPAWLDPLCARLRAMGCFGVRLGPAVTAHWWDAERVKEGLADAQVARYSDLDPSGSDPVGVALARRLAGSGWRLHTGPDGFGDGQPQHNVAVALADGSGAAYDDEAMHKRVNRQWRRNVQRAAKEGVEVSRWFPRAADEVADELAAFTDLHAHTGERDGFATRDLDYFRALVDELGSDGLCTVGLWAAHHEGDHVAGLVTVHLGARTWLSYGASSTEKRDVRGSNAVQWAAILDARDRGARVADLRGVVPSLDPSDPETGLIGFKVSLGPHVNAYPGEWDKPLRPLVYRAFDLLVNR